MPSNSPLVCEVSELRRREQTERDRRTHPRGGSSPKAAQSELIRCEELFKKDSIFERMLRDTRLTVERAVANLEIAEAELQAAKAGVDISRSNKSKPSPDGESKPSAKSLDPQMQLPGGRSTQSQNTDDANKKVATEALIRVAAARRKLAKSELENAQLLLSVINESNKNVPGSVTQPEVKRASLGVDRATANVAIAEAELDAAKAGFDISRSDNPKPSGERTLPSERTQSTLPTYKGSSQSI